MDSLAEKLRHFECRRCNECCKQPGFVYLMQEEADKIAAHLKQDPFDFINEFCELQDRRQLVLKKHEDESCIFLGENGCTVYDARPRQCRDFPFGWRTERSFEYCEGLKGLKIKNEKPMGSDPQNGSDPFGELS